MNKLCISVKVVVTEDTTTYSFRKRVHLTRENSFGVVDQSIRYVDYTIGIKNDLSRGWFEIDGGDEDWYAEGCLELDGRRVTGYDGMFTLDDNICDVLETHNFDCSEVRDY